jgi:hypothetical protein
MLWHLSDRFDPRALRLADQHYSRQKPGTRQFVSPSRALVLLNREATALWVSTWPRFAGHAWKGAWICNLFRNESGALSSEMIRQAVAATRARWGDPPSLGMVTFIKADAVRRKRDPGRCFLRAGFRRVGVTKVRQLIVLQLLTPDMPDAERACGTSANLLTP